MRASLSALLAACLVLSGVGYYTVPDVEDFNVPDLPERSVVGLGFTVPDADPPPAAPRVGSRTHVEILAIIFVAEAGWRHHADHALIAHMFSRRAMHLRRKDGTRWSFIGQAMAYSRGTWISKRHRGLWLQDMRENCEVPERWPYHRSRWDRYYRPRCDTVIALARAFLRDPSSLREPTCTASVWHFGFTGDKPKPGQIRIDCGKTKNIYYTVPRYKFPGG